MRQELEVESRERLGLLLWQGFDPWPGTFCKPWVWGEEAEKPGHICTKMEMTWWKKRN